MLLKIAFILLCLSQAIAAQTTNNTIIENCYEAYLAEEYYSFNYPSYAGVAARVKEFPHLTAIGWKSNNSVSWGCGGSLITLKFILTAAHCCYKSVLGIKTPANVARMGTVDLDLDTVSAYVVPNINVTDREKYAQQFEIIRVSPHPAYQSNKRYHDVALMELDREAKITDFVIPICLWNKKNVVFTTLEAVGYGETEFGFGISPTLMKIRITQTDLGECQKTYPAGSDRRLPDGLVQEQHLCARDKTNKDMDTCEGDSGGPLEFKVISKNSDLKWIKVPVLAGVTSFGQSGCGSSAPGVYTRVASYIDWLETQTKADLSLESCTSRHTNLREVTQLYTHDVDLPSNVRINGDECPGIIIHKRYILTSTECTKITKPKTIHTVDKQQIEVSTIHINDGLVLLKLKEEIKYSSRTIEELSTAARKGVALYYYKVGPTCFAEEEDFASNQKFDIVQATFRNSPLKYIQSQYNVSECTTFLDVKETLTDSEYECVGGYWFAPNQCQIEPSTFTIIENEYPRFSNVYTPIPMLKGLLKQHDSCGAILTRKILKKDIDWINQMIFPRVSDPKIYFELPTTKKPAV